MNHASRAPSYERSDDDSGASDSFAKRFYVLTGFFPSTAALKGLPTPFLSHAVESPAEILAKYPVEKRTRSALQRFLQGDSTGALVVRPWTFERLIRIPGFGLWCLMDVLEAMHAIRGGDLLSDKNTTLADELEALLTLRPHSEVRPTTPHLRRALAIVGRHMPASEVEVGRMLVDAGLAATPPDLAQIERAARFCNISIAFTVFRREGIAVVIPENKLALARLVYGLAVRFLKNWGLAPFQQITLQMGNDQGKFARAILSARSNFRWLDRAREWFWFRNPESRLVRKLEKVVSVAGSIKLTHLARSVFRNWPPEHIPPLPVLRSLCADLPQFLVEGPKIRLARDVAPPLTRAEGQLLDLFRSFGPRLSGGKLPFVASRIGLAVDLLRRALRSSPLVLEVEPGIFQLVGT